MLCVAFFLFVLYSVKIGLILNLEYMIIFTFGKLPMVMLNII